MDMKLKKQRDELKRYQKRIHGVLEKDRQLARKLLQEGKKDRAKLLLRKKKYQEGLLSRTDGQLENLERLVHDLEFAQIERQVLSGLKEGNEALKKANAMFSIEEIEAIMDDTAEAVEKQNEISALLSGQLSQQDEDDVLRELDELAQLEQDLAHQQIDEDIKLPDVPSDALSEKVKNTKKDKPVKVAVEAS